MRKLLAIFLTFSLVLLACPHPARAAGAFVQSVNGASCAATSTTTTCTLTGVATGNALLICINSDAANGSTLTAAVNNGNTFVSDDFTQVPGGSENIRCGHVTNTFSGTTVLTITSSVSTHLQGTMMEASGASTSTQPQQHNANQGNSGTMTPGSITTTSTTINMVCYFSNNGSIPTTLTGWTLIGSTSGFAQCFYQANGAAATLNPSQTTLSSNWVAGIIAMNQAGAVAVSGSQHGGNHAAGGARKIY